MKYFVYILIISLVNLAHAETKIYTETENEGLNKKERIDGIEKYLVEISKSVKDLESKFSENAKKVNEIEKIISKIKTENEQVVAQKSGEQKDSKKDEIAKIKADVDTLKSNKDLDKLKIEVLGLGETIKSIQKILESKGHY